ncbi:hypothetical protein [Burkholderia multivorans]|uniref:hypothetical protein n=1 Tax=Burkholderia multivorans TaxID=87883 RepID=UPI001C2173AC|nr:hypothetical protein [Burkholderia multivorans]MBU9211668.1 hypothetical protein [Burkholderia multivorans]
MGSIQIPAEHWEAMAAANSCHMAAEHKGNKPLPVRTAEYGGFLYTAFATMWGRYGGAIQPYVDAYRLLPPSVYTGETTLVYHDEKAIKAGLRERGDHTGLIVSANGKLMVCAEGVRFILGLPGTRPLSLAEAKDYDERQRRSGWRALWFSGKEPEWFSLRGHPVAVYRDHSTLHEDHAVLLWKAKGEIHELSIDDDVVLSLAEELQTAPSVATPEGQLALF